MKPETEHKWNFRPRFRRTAFGWRSQLAIKRIKEAVSEIKKVARKNPILGAEGAVVFLEKLSPAIEQVDSSSGSMGISVCSAIETLVPIIAEALADDCLRDKWVERLWEAVQEDNIPYLELLPEYWGDLCVSSERASQWADRFIEIVRMVWGKDSARSGYFKGSTVCLSSLFKAERYDEILELVNLVPYKFWPYRQWGVKALTAMGKVSEALQYANDSCGLNDNPIPIAQTCEKILLQNGMIEESYNQYAILANRKGTYLATFRSICKKYPHKKESVILRDLISSTPLEEGKWFAAAKSAGLYKEAIELANRTPCDPKTLTRAARDMGKKDPLFAIEAGIPAFRWLLEGYDMKSAVRMYGIPTITQ